VELPLLFQLFLLQEKIPVEFRLNEFSLKEYFLLGISANATVVNAPTGK
jgi:hypothetical protein